MATILVVDDQSSMRTLLREHLGDQGHEVLEAANGVEAMAMVGEAAPDLVLSDMIMPSKDGRELLCEIRTVAADTPVIIITGVPSVDAAVACLKLGAADYLPKPLDFERLDDVIRTCLSADCPSRSVVMPTNTGMRVVAGYRIRQRIGEGNFAIVYLAERAGEGGVEQVAVKILREGLRGEARSRFNREARAAAAVRHPNIVHILEFDVADDAPLPYIVMEYVRGMSLADRFQALATAGTEDKVRIVRQLLCALNAIHGHGMCHRDIKPQNVMLDQNNQVKVTDFGIVRVADSALTRAGNLLGTPNYMAPEAFESAAVDARADLFSAGVVAYELLVGEQPFPGERVTDVAQRIAAWRPRRPTSAAPHLPATLEGILGALIRKDRDRRYQSAADAIADLDAFLDGLPVTRCRALGANVIDWT